jgi:hypothetical protein
MAIKTGVTAGSGPDDVANNTIVFVEVSGGNVQNVEITGKNKETTVVIVRDYDNAEPEKGIEYSEGRWP